MKNTLAFICLLFVSFNIWGQSVIKLSSSFENTPLKLPAIVDYFHPNGKKGWYLRGLNTENDGTYDLRKYYALRMCVKGEVGQLIDVRCVLLRDEMKNERHNLIDSTDVSISVKGTGEWQEVNIPISSFNYNKGQEYFLKFIKHIKIELYSKTQTGIAYLSDVCFVRAHTLALESDIYSRPLDEKFQTEYKVKVTNTTNTFQTIMLSIKKDGWEGMDADVVPSSLSLNPEESAYVSVKVRGSDYLPSGASEVTVLQAIPLFNNAKTEELNLISVVPVKSPFVVHNDKEWKKVKENIEKYDWAKNEYDEILRVAEAFQVPEVKKGTMSDQGTEGLVRAYIESSLHKTAIAFYLTGNSLYGEKVAETLRRLTDPIIGYPRTNHLTFQGIPQEGGTMEGMLFAYDLIKNSDLLSNEDRSNIEHTFRLYCNNIIDMMGDGGISNWSVFNLAPAAECALMIHDMHLFNELAYGPCGLIDQLRYGTMDDGWWYEMSLSYNLGCAACYTTVALAARPFGIDWLNREFPSSLTRKVGLRPFEYENLQGMAFGKFGPIHDNTITIKKMWDGILLYPDYRGVMFGMGDGHEQMVAGNQFELAYYAFRDPRYVSILKCSPKRSLLYGVSELPGSTLDISSASGYSDNAGLSVLRSKGKNDNPEDRIQVVLKYGTHGGYHGHFDRISLLSLMRYGRSFYNPETSWFGYGSFMYKWWVQSSMSHNMVVVDGKMQEPTTCNRLLDFSGDLMQAFAVSTDARWSNPPYMGGYDQISKVKNGDAPYVPIVTDKTQPIPGDIGVYSEPVHQRRLAIVTNDYVIVADYLKSDSIHVFDNLWQLRGVSVGDDFSLDGEDAQWDTNPLSSGQFITSVKKYHYDDCGLLHSIHRFAKQGKDGMNLAVNNWETGGQNRLYNKEGNLCMDMHLLWPRKSDVRIGDYAESWGNDKKMKYCILADKKEVLSNCFRPWILGCDSIDIDVAGKKEIIIEIETDRKSGKSYSLMFANARFITESGKHINLSSLKPDSENIVSLPNKGKDYQGGPIKIAGKLYKDAVGIEPKDSKKIARLVYNIENLGVVRLEGILGNDYFVGDEEQLRKTVGVRQNGKEVCFVTLIEPFEKESIIETVNIKSQDEIEICLNDGRKQRLYIDDFYQKNGNMNIIMEEWKDNQLLRKESVK